MNTTTFVQRSHNNDYLYVSNITAIYLNVICYSIFYKHVPENTVFIDYLIVFILMEDFIRKSTKSTLLTKYIHILICTTHHQLHMQTLYIIQNELI